MRKSTLLWLSLAAFCGAALFHTSQKVHDGREKLETLGRDLAREEDAQRVLQAEWSYLNQPRRLEKLAREHLKLAPLKGAQFVKIDDLALRPALPPEAEPAAEKPEAKKVVAEETLVEEAAESAPEKAASEGRKFGDVMKSLGVEPWR